MTSRGVKYVSKDDEEKTKLLSDDIFQDEYEVWNMNMKDYWNEKYEEKVFETCFFRCNLQKILTSQRKGHENYLMSHMH